MSRSKPIKVKHEESGEPISSEAKGEIEELLADLLFEAWLKDKGLK